MTFAGKDETMKILHFSDTHLGFSEYTRIDPETGLNQRELDFYRAWEQVIEAILTLQPDVVVHAGDLFHTTRPSNRAIRVALENLQKVSQAGIPMVLISGNHETPRIRTTGSIFESLSLLDHVYAAYSSQYAKFRIKKIDFHCVPHCSITEEMEAAIQDIRLDPKAEMNILISHGAWSAKSYYGMGEFNELRLPDIETQLGIRFDYIALGHYHRQVDVKEHVCYSGSTERTSLNEAGSPCGFLMIDTDGMQKEYHEIRTRPMIKKPALDCHQLTATEIYDRLEAMAGDDIEEAIVQIVLNDLDEQTFLKLDSRTIEEIFSSAFYLEKQFNVRSLGEDSPSSASIDSLPVEFERYIEKLDSPELDKQKLIRMGQEYLEEVS